MIRQTRRVGSAIHRVGRVSSGSGSMATAAAISRRHATPRGSFILCRTSIPAPTDVAPTRDISGWVRPRKRALVACAASSAGVRYDQGSIGRVVTSGEVRGTGVGKALMAEALRRLESLAPGQPVKIAAQRRLEDFYLGFGFRTVSDPYEEDGITHVDMLI